MSTRHDFGMNPDRRIFSGDTIAIALTVTNDEDGTIQPLNGALATFVICDKNPDPTNSTNILITKTVGNGITLTDPTNGLMTIIITDANTESLHGIYYHETRLQIGTVVQRAMYGLIRFRSNAIL